MPLSDKFCVYTVLFIKNLREETEVGISLADKMCVLALCCVGKSMMMDQTSVRGSRPNVEKNSVFHP